MLARIKKALVAGAGAGIAAVVAAMSAGMTLDADGVTKLVLAFLAAAIPVGLATWKVRNAPA